MLKLTPFKISGFLLFLFCSVIGVQHFVFSITTQKNNSEMDVLNFLEERLPFLMWLERTDYDFHLKQQEQKQVHPDVVIVEVNERSIQELGQFPFARATYAKLLYRLQEYGAKVAAFDITFPEKERNESFRQLGELREEILRSKGPTNPALAMIDARIRQQDGDKQFANALANLQMPVVLGFAFTGDAAVSTGAKSESPEQLELLKKFTIFRRQVSDNAFLHNLSERIAILNHAELMSSLREQSSVAAITADPDKDSVIRQAVGALGYKGIALTSLAVRATAAYLGVEPILDGSDGLAIRDREDQGKLYVPLSPSGTYLLRYYGKERMHPYIEFSDVISDDPAIQAKIKDQLNGKIVFIGVTAVGLKDIRANPYSKDYPGVEVHATFASNTLDRVFMVKDQRYFLFAYLFTLCFGALVSWLVYRMNPAIAVPVTLVLAIALQIIVQQFFFDQGIIVPSFLPTFAAFVLLFAGVLFRYFTEEREKKKVRGAFSRYVSGAVVEEILKDQSKLKLGGQKKQLTVMFCDLKGFTKLSENMDATKLTAMLNEYFTRMTSLILKNQGTLDKYMGDAIMCFWGAPLDIPNHAELACKTAVEMVQELEAINRVWQEKYNITINIRIGLHTGEMSVGNMGSEQVFSYTVMGDHVNLGSRLEGVNNIYGTTVIVSEATRQGAGNKFSFRDLDRVLVKGKEESVKIFELLSAKGLEQEWQQQFSAAQKAYTEGNWQVALQLFADCLERRPQDGPCQTFIKRIQEFREPPKDWNGIWKIESK
jgi:adenylate cyclase